AEPHARGRARDRSQIGARHRHHVEGRRMVLRHVQAIEAGRLRGLDEGEALVEQGRERTTGMLHVVEQSEFHRASRGSVAAEEDRGGPPNSHSRGGGSSAGGAKCGRTSSESCRKMFRLEPTAKYAELRRTHMRR